MTINRRTGIYIVGICRSWRMECCARYPDSKLAFARRHWQWIKETFTSSQVQASLFCKVRMYTTKSINRSSPEVKKLNTKTWTWRYAMRNDWCLSFSSPFHKQWYFLDVLNHKNRFYNGMGNHNCLHQLFFACLRCLYRTVSSYGSSKLRNHIYMVLIAN